jgi:alpha-tubulin suppressor-like RCC1 family protein
LRHKKQLKKLLQRKQKLPQTQKLLNKQSAFDSPPLRKIIMNVRFNLSKIRGKLYGAFALLAMLAAPLSAQPPQIASGDDFTAIIDSSNNLFTYGSNDSGQLGIGDDTDTPGEMNLVEPAGVWEFVAVSKSAESSDTAATGSGHVLAIRTDGSLWAWGANDRGQLGIGTTEDSDVPVQVSSGSWVEVAAGSNFSMARKSTGEVFVWGDNTRGQLARAFQVSTSGTTFGDPDYAGNMELYPVALNQGDEDYTYTSIAAGLYSGFAIRDSGKLYTWGYSDTMQLGQSNKVIGPATTLLQIGSSTAWTQVFAGNTTCFALRSGKLYAWGASGSTGTGGAKYTPTRIGSASDWESVAVGHDHTLALKNGGELWGWGDNNDGELGLPLYDSSAQANEDNFYLSTPQRLESGTTFEAIGAGLNFSSVYTSDAFLLTAGINDVGQLGDGSTNSGYQDTFVNSSLGGADLVGTGVTVSSALPWAGPNVSASFSMTNQGTGSITTPFYISAVLSSNQNYDGADTIPLEFAGGGTEFEVLLSDVDPLIAGQSLSVPFSFILPGNIDQGQYYLVVRADATNLIEETYEDNNDAATETDFEFYPDLVVSTLTVTGGIYESNDDIEIDVTLENDGAGTIPAGATFELRLFLSPDKTSDNSAAVDLDADPDDDLESYYTVTLTDDFNPSTDLTLPTFNLSVPRMPEGYYFLGADVDVNNTIEEQTEIVENNVVLRQDGEDNNLTFTATASIEIDGITIPEAIDQTTLVDFTTSGDGTWFGQSTIFNSAIAGNTDAVQSPSLASGSSAEFSTNFESGTKPYAITFDWKAETSSLDNKLSYRVINGTTGGAINEISGITEWESKQRVVPANARAEWVYEQGADGSSDAVYVDNLNIREITAPDLVIDDIYLPDDATGSYVLMRDRLDLTVNSRNQGTATNASDDFVVSIYLSKDRVLDRPDANAQTPDDILIRQGTVSRVFASGDPAVNGFSITLDEDIDEGEYYIIGYIDDYTDANGDLLTGATDPDGKVAEFVVSDSDFEFDGEGNNAFVSSSTIEIVTLADLIVSGINADPNYYIIEDSTTGEANDMEFDFTVANIGLAAVNTDVATSILFSEDQVFDVESDYLLLDYNYNGNFGDINSGANERLISPDAIDFRQDLVDAGYIGRRLFIGVNIDSEDAVEELDEEHNSSYLVNNDFILSEFSIAEGLDLNSTTISAYNITVANDEVAPYESDQIPWVGQSTVTIDGYDAITNTIIDDGETSEFSIDIEPSTGARVSFWWKVSSQNDLENGLLDYLRFEVDGTQAVTDIYGTEGGWSRVEVALDAGSHTLTWSYVKDDEGSDGEDRGWVDYLTIEEMPDLQVSAVAVDGLSVYSGGATIDTWSVTVVNNGDVIEAGSEFDIAVRLLPQDSWLESNSIQLLTITDPDGLGVGESRTYNASTVVNGSNLGSLTLPDVDYTQEFYYVGAYVDWYSLDLSNGQILESNESNNDTITESASIQIGLPDLTGRAIADGSGVTGVDAAGYDFTSSPDVDLTLHLINSGDGVLPAGSTFEVAVYAVSSNSATALDSSSVYELDSVSVTTTAAVASGDLLDTIDVSTTLPYGIPIGSYYVGVEIDTTDTVEEQGALPSLLRPNDTRDDGEENNTFFTASPSFIISGITVAEGIDLLTDSIEFDGDVNWFGRDDAGDPDTAADNQTFTDGDGAQSPVMSEGGVASFSLGVVNSSVVKFDWAAETLSDQNVLSVTVNGEEIRSLSGELSLSAVEPFVVPDGATIRWVYSKGADTVGDVAYIDNLELLSNTLPDLTLTDVSYVAGEYVLSRDVEGDSLDGDGNPDYLGSKYLDLSATAENQGSDLAASTGSFSSADIEVRLSVNSEYGDADDVILGSFAQVEGDFNSTNLLSFLGPITLGDHIPAGFYHLIVLVDSNDRVTEFTEENNLYISDLADIQITRLPDLTIENLNSKSIAVLSNELVSFSDIIDVDETQRYNPNGSVRVRFNIQNIGLGDVSGEDSFTTQISLRGIPRPDGEDPGDEYILIDGDSAALSDLYDAATSPIILNEFNIQDELNGRGYDSVTGVYDGESKSIDIELFIPSGLYLSAVIDEDKGISDYLWFFEVIVNRDYPFEETNVLDNTWWSIDSATLLDSTGSIDWINEFNGGADDGLFGIEYTQDLADASSWETEYGVTVSDPGMLLAYAFNRNPASGDTSGNTFPGSYGIIRVEGEADAEDEDYLSITFDFVAVSTDLIYQVVADNVVTFDDDPEVLLEINTEPGVDNPYGGYINLVGPRSLTGEGGLVDEENVLSVHDQGYSARVTVVDTVPTSATDQRFIRVVVGGTASSSVAIQQSVEDFSLYQMNLLGVTDADDAAHENDYDGDGVSNLVELLYNTDPTNSGDVPALTNDEQEVATDMADAIVAFGGTLSVPTANIGSADDYDGDGIGNLWELYFGTDPADILDF